MRVNVYVDGFNFYYGATARQPHKWLDIEAFVRTMLRPSDVINRIWYCTAEVDGKADVDAPNRQQTYFRALRTIPCLEIEFGSFITTYPYMRPAQGGRRVQVRKSEEKGSDVNLAAHLLMDAFKGDFDVALMITNDSDLVTPIKMVTSEFALPVGVAMPLLNRNGNGTPRRPSVELMKVASFRRFIKDDSRWHRRLATSQFPETLTDAVGSFSRPTKWGAHPY